MTTQMKTLLAVVAAVLGLAGCQPVGDSAGSTTGTTVARAWPYAVVMVEDHTGAFWPVTTAVHQWDAGTDQQIRYGRCRAHAGCVRVFEHDAGDNGDAGVTDARWTGRAMIAATVYLNDAYAGNGPLAALAATCHEIGHGLGLPHNPSRSSCLYPRVDVVGAEEPDAHDRAALNQAWRAIRSSAGVR